MTITALPLEAAPGITARGRLAAGLRDLADWIETSTGPLPVVRAAFTVPPGPRGARIACLEDIAAALGTDVTEDRHGTLIAARHFGPVTASAHLAHPDASTSGWLTRARAARTGAAA